MRRKADAKGLDLESKRYGSQGELFTVWARAPPLPPASGSVIEVERLVNASGNISIAGHVISAGLPLAGQRVTARLGGPSPTSSPTAPRSAPLPARSPTKPGSGCAEHAARPPDHPSYPSLSLSGVGSLSGARS